MLQNDGIKIRDFTNRDIPKFFISESMQNQNEKWMKWFYMKTNLDKIDYESIYDYSLEEWNNWDTIQSMFVKIQKLLKKYNIVIVKGE